MELMTRGMDEKRPRFGKGGGGDEQARLREETTLREAAYAGMVLERLARHTCRIAAVEWSCIFVRDIRDPRRVIAAAGNGVPWEALGSRFGADEGVVGRVLASGNPALVGDCAELAGSVFGGGEDQPCPGAAVPIALGAEVHGVLAAATKAPGRQLGSEDLALLAELADLAAAALAHGERREHYDETVRAHVESLAAAMDMRDRRTARHSEDVVRLARAVGELLDLETASMLELEIAARLHDVGKIRVPDAVLNKAGPLDGDESEVIRCHVTWGAETLSQIPGLEAVATVVRFHHERWDGLGYPEGLRGARIPLASRIISVCDAFGAMTCDRPYRAAMAVEVALEEVRACAGSQFDPAVVEALFEAVAASRSSE
jgi:GAF domain-containing protein